MPVLGSNKLTLLVSEGKWDMAMQLIREEPNLVKERSPCPGFFGDGKVSDVFPIHQAVASFAPTNFLEQLLQIHPTSIVKEESAYRRTPLHIACKNGSSVETISFLLRQNKDCAARQDSMGRIPLHYALSNGDSLEIVEKLLKASPISVGATDNGGWTPLHVACNVGLSFDVVKTLVEADKEGVITRTNNGSNPVILATKANSPDKERVLEYLKKEEDEINKKTEFIRIRNAERKATEKEKNALTVRKVGKRGSVRELA
uniref:Uncharacterized protein n=2 Tax=Ditylum brightwellii TaxID=49249 RepID=A0A6U4A9D2_9STRA